MEDASDEPRAALRERRAVPALVIQVYQASLGMVGHPRGKLRLPEKKVRFKVSQE